MSCESLALVIPAYNEATRIGAVIEPALCMSTIESIVVVDDGSSDSTADIADSYGVTILRHPSNLGKGEAMHTGYKHAKELGSTAMLFLDADLHGLSSEHIDKLISPVLSGEALMTIGILERTLLQRKILTKWGALSGQRAMAIGVWEKLKPLDRHGFNVEAALNSTARHQGWHSKIERVELRHLTHTGKREKEPTLTKATIAYAKTYGQALLTYCRLEVTK